MAERSVREALHRCLAASDCFWGAEEARKDIESNIGVGGQGGSVSTPAAVEKKEEVSPEKPLEKSRSEVPLPGLSGKAASPCRPVSPVVTGRGNQPAEDTTPGKESQASVEEEKKSNKHRKRKRKSRSGSRRSRSRRRRRSAEIREREDSPGFERSEEEVPVPRAPVRPSSARPVASEGRREASRSRPLARRDYSGYYQQPNWVGPIPAAGSRDREHPRGRSPRQAINKGAKKRRQQEKARSFGGWNNRGGRGWQRR